MRGTEQEGAAWPRISLYIGRKQSCFGHFDTTPDIVMRMDLRSISARSLEYGLRTNVTPPL